ncbi:hypothetical protein BRADI_5g14026v3 [Brachypodium distachyon]|uniref:Uncharacterized protein n=1 Tax=Brachypodium distachyon TaxID=15368 RepID=A0A0Q3KSW7_BRADI|nr:hypothetical protein BRADI_5g14026v3 [Brachypodium distachyon]
MEFLLSLIPPSVRCVGAAASIRRLEQHRRNPLFRTGKPSSNPRLLEFPSPLTSARTVAHCTLLFASSIVREARKAFIQQDNELSEMRQRLQAHADYMWELRMQTK